MNEPPTDPQGPPTGPPEPPSGPPLWGPPPAGGAAPQGWPPPQGWAPPTTSGGTTVPRWVPAVVAGLLALLLGFGGGFAAGFFTGRATADDRDQVEPFRPRRPLGPVPAPILPRARAAYLGVLARPAGGEGAEIVEVVAGSPAERAGLQVGDVITRFDGATIDGPADLVQAVRGHDPGDEVEVAYRRGDQTATVTVELGRRSRLDDFNRRPSQ